MGPWDPLGPQFFPSLWGLGGDLIKLDATGMVVLRDFLRTKMVSCLGWCHT